MAELSVVLSPPNPSTSYNSFLPNEYLQSSPVVRAVKRKSGLSVSTPTRKKLKFDITPNNDDIDMACYKKRIDVALGYPRLMRVLLPMECINNMQKSIKQLEQENTEQQRQLTEQQRQLTEQQRHLTEQQRQLTELQQINKSRLKMMRANLLTDFVKKICGKSPVPSSPVQNSLGHDSSRLAIEAASIDRKKLLKAEVDPKYVSVLKNFSWYTSLRNTSAHETEVDFARMLLSTDLYETEEYYKWAGLFPYTYGGSVEEIAARDDLEPAPDHQEPKFSPPTQKYQF